MAAPTIAPPAIRTCPHTPPCPPAEAVDHDAAQVVAEHHDQGWELLCNGVVVFDDTGELLPGGASVAPHRPEPPHRPERTARMESQTTAPAKRGAFDLAHETLMARYGTADPDRLESLGADPTEVGAAVNIVKRMAAGWVPDRPTHRH